jgi:methylase of polypeptide subunit release factors
VLDLEVAADPPSLSFAAARVDAPARAALGALGDQLRQSDLPDWATTFMRGEPADRADLATLLSTDDAGHLVDAGLAAIAGSRVTLAITVSDMGGVLTAVPKAAWGDEVVYIGEDSIYLIEAALRLAPRGERAADLGTGTGLLAAMLASRYRSVVGTDVARSVAGAADLTLALNRRPRTHAAAILVTDVGRGLRADAFDLVVANAPWVPLASESAEPREIFAHGGEEGVELPRRFLLEGAALLRPGGVAVTLALDVEIHGEHRPLRAACAGLTDAGYVVALLPTPFNRDRPHLLQHMAHRQPSLTAATHVAAVVARPAYEGDTRDSLVVAIEFLRRRWAAPL